MSSGSEGIPGVWKARTGFETIMTRLDELKECFMRGVVPGNLTDGVWT